MAIHLRCSERVEFSASINTTMKVIQAKKFILASLLILQCVIIYQGSHVVHCLVAPPLSSSSSSYGTTRTTITTTTTSLSSTRKRRNQAERPRRSGRDEDLNEIVTFEQLRQDDGNGDPIGTWRVPTNNQRRRISMNPDYDEYVELRRQRERRQEEEEEEQQQRQNQPSNNSNNDNNNSQSSSTNSSQGAPFTWKRFNYNIQQNKRMKDEQSHFRTNEQDQQLKRQKQIKRHIRTRNYRNQSYPSVKPDDFTPSSPWKRYDYNMQRNKNLIDEQSHFRRNNNRLTRSFLRRDRQTVQDYTYFSQPYSPFKSSRPYTTSEFQNKSFRPSTNSNYGSNKSKTVSDINAEIDEVTKTTNEVQNQLDEWKKFYPRSIQSQQSQRVFQPYRNVDNDGNGSISAMNYRTLSSPSTLSPTGTSINNKNGNNSRSRVSKRLQRQRERKMYPPSFNQRKDDPSNDAYGQESSQEFQASNTKGNIKTPPLLSSGISPPQENKAKNELDQDTNIFTDGRSTSTGSDAIDTLPMSSPKEQDTMLGEDSEMSLPLLSSSSVILDQPIDQNKVESNQSSRIDSNYDDFQDDSNASFSTTTATATNIGNGEKSRNMNNSSPNVSTRTKENGDDNMNREGMPSSFPQVPNFLKSFQDAISRAFDNDRY